MERLYEGKFECEECEVKYLAQDDPACRLICPKCGSPLRELDDEISDGPEDEESEDDDT